MQLERINWKNGTILSGLDFGHTEALLFEEEKVTRNEQISRPAETDLYGSLGFVSVFNRFTVLIQLKFSLATVVQHHRILVFRTLVAAGSVPRVKPFDVSRFYCAIRPIL